MSFNKTIHLLSILAAIGTMMSLSSCSLMRDQAKVSSPHSSGLECLQTAPIQLQKLFNGDYGNSEIDRSQVRAIWSCLDYSLKTFSAKAHGAKPNSYSVTELQSFANRFLPADKQLNESFAAAIFKLKSSVVGGRDTELSKAEIVELVNKLNEFGEMMVSLSPYIGSLINPEHAQTKIRIDSRLALLQFSESLSEFFGRSAAPFAWSDLNLFIAELETYLGKTNHIFASASATLQSTAPFLIGGKSEFLSQQSLEQLIQKGTDLYLTWTETPKKSISEAVGTTLEIVLRTPNFYSVTLSEILQAAGEVRSFVEKSMPTKKADWELYESYVVNGLKLKSILFHNSENSITTYELSQCAYLFEPFRKGDSIEVAMTSLSSLLQKRTFSNANVSELYDLANSFLPNNKGLQAYGVSEKILEDLKVILIGGEPSVIASSEYSAFAKMFSDIYAKVYMKATSLPKDFKTGLNSDTIDIAKSALDGLLYFHRDPIPVTAIKTLLNDIFLNMGNPVPDNTLNKVLIGLSTRILSHSKDTKPDSLDELVVYLDQLRPAVSMLERLRKDLKDIETAFQGIDVSSQTLSRDELGTKLLRDVPLKLLSTLQPILNGSNHLIQFPKKGEKTDHFYAYDLAYKTFAYNLLSYLFPLYKIEKDPNGASQLRLSHDDLVDLLTDYNDLVYDLKLSYSSSTAEQAASSRMRSINLFTRSGNGDNYLDIFETTEFLTITKGGKVLLSRIEESLFPVCAPGLKKDQIKFISYDCLSKQFFSKEYMAKTYGDVAPRLIDQYLSWDDETRDSFRKSALTATRPDWTEDGMFPIADFETLIALPYYIENIFERFDTNGDDLLQYSEIMKGFPIFCGEIQKAGGNMLASEDCSVEGGAYKTKAIYGFLLFNGRPPRGIKSGDRLFAKVKAAKEYLSWMKYWKNLSQEASDRDQNPPQLNRNDLLQIISNLSEQASSP